jgi:hypothetical protein
MAGVALAGIMLLMMWVAPLAATEESHRGSAPADALLSLIPRDGELDGWVRDGTSVLCYDEESLSEYIDGAAPYYLERGAVAVLFQYYLRPASGEEAKIEIYRMRDRPSARLLFEEIEKGKPASPGTEIGGLGEDYHLEQALLGIDLLEFHEGPFFVRIEVRGRGQRTQREAIEFGLRICRSIRELPPGAE